MPHIRVEILNDIKVGMVDSSVEKDNEQFFREVFVYLPALVQLSLKHRKSRQESPT